MATAVFEFAGTALGTAIGGPLGGQIGGFIGAGLGAYVDNQIVSAISAPDPPRLADLNVQVSTYGRPIAKMFGEEVRLAGNVIWSTGLVERLEGGKGGPPGSEHYAYSTSLAVALGEGGANGGGLERVVKIWANGKLIYDETAAGPALPATDTDQGYTIGRSSDRFSVFTSLYFHPGSLVQAADPTIELVQGVDDTQTYKGICYVVINALQLADFGNRLPNLEFLIKAKTGETVAGAAQWIVDRCGIAPESVSTSQVDVALRGYVIGNKANGLGGLQPLALAYSFDIAEVWGSLRLQPRGTSVVALIPADDLGAHDARSSRDEPIRWPRRPETALPSEASISFIDPARDYQANTQRAMRVSGSADAKVANEVALTLTADEGRALADRLLWEAWTSRQSAAALLSDRWLSLEPGRSYLVENRNGRQRIKVVQATRGANGVHRVELRRDRPEVYRSTAPGAAAPPHENAITLPGDTIWQPLDLPILREVDDDSGFYWAVEAEESGWRGMDLFRSTDGVSYDHVDRLGTETIMGTISGTPASGPTHVWDYATIITVTLDVADDALSSVTEAEVLGGANLCWIGDADGADGELLQFTTATLTAPGVYELTNLLRGRFGTEYAVGAHAAAERFVLVQPAGFNRSDFGQADWNKTRDYKPLSVLQALADVTAIPFTNTGEGKRPISPVHIHGTRDTSNNLTLDWIRRSRIPAPGLGNGNVPLGEAVESYELDIFDGAAVVRVITSATPTAPYTAAQQTADGLTPGDPVSGEVFQISDSRGRGRPLAFTV